MNTVLVSWAAVTNGHELGTSKQQKFIIPQLWRPEFWIFLVSSSFWWLQACGHITPISASMATWLPFLSQIALCLTLIRILVTGFRAHPNNPRWSPRLRILYLITYAKSLFLNEIPSTCFRDEHTDTFFGVATIPVTTIVKF